MALRRAVTLFLCAVMILFIFGAPCYFKLHRVDYNDHYKELENISAWKGVISMWDFPRLNIKYYSRFGWLKNKIKEFEKKNPGVYIDLRELDWTEGPLLLKAAAKAGAYPDIAPVGSDFYYISKGALEELDQYIVKEDMDDFTQPALKSVMYNGRIYGIPWMTTGYALLLNTDLFSEREVSLPKDGSWTYDEFVEAAKKLTYDSDKRHGPDVFGFNSFIEPGAYNAYGIIFSDGAQFIDKSSGRYSFFYPEAVSGLKKLWDLKYTYKVTPPQFGEMNENAAWTSFLKGKAAMYTAGAWAIPYLRSAQYNINFTVAGFPIGSTEVPVTFYSNPCSYAVFKQQDEGKKQMCIKLIQFITSKENQVELANFGYFPVRKSGADIYQNDKEMSIVQQSLTYAEALPQLYNWDEIDLVIQSKVKAAINGELTPEQALQETRPLVERYMNER